MAARSGGDGKELEDLVATIEGLLVPQGFAVEKNRRVYDDDGVPLGEFDITITGKLGSANITWLIECRNRPSDGAAPSAWIEQLVGRRSRFKFDKVTAVSTTGFASGAVAFANTAGIDLCEVSQIAPELTKWLALRSLRSLERRHWLTMGRVRVSEDESPQRITAATNAILNKPLGGPVLRTITGATISVLDAFVIAVAQMHEPFADVVPDQPKRVSFTANYPRDDHYVLDTAEGPVRVTCIDFDGELSIIETAVPLDGLSEYRQVGSDQPVSQTAGFTFPVKGDTIAFDLHHLTASGETHMSLRKVGPAPAPKDGKSTDK